MFAKLVFWQFLDPMEGFKIQIALYIEMQDAECWSHTERGQASGFLEFVRIYHWP